MRRLAQRFIVVASAALLTGVALPGATKTSAAAPGSGVIPGLRLAASKTGLHRRANPATCSGKGQYSFVGGSGGPSFANVAGGAYSGVLSGIANFACGVNSGVMVGDANETDAGADFVGGGYGNLVGSDASGFANTNGIVAGQINTNGGDESLIGAGSYNAITSSCTSSNHCSGGFATAIVAGEENEISGSSPGTANYSLIGAGGSNNVTGQYAAIIAGEANTESADYGFIGAGSKNAMKALYGSVVGGFTNSVTGGYAFIGGGSTNVASGQNAVVPGGYHNVAKGVGSFAAGLSANALHNGTFVWSDQNTRPAVASTGPDQFIARASGGVKFYSSVNQSTGVSLAAGSGSWSSVSDRAVKTAIAPVDDSTILAKVAGLPISEWSYTAQGVGVRHVGPMAQDFYAAFNVGEDNKHITTIDEDGVALAAIKGLNAEVRSQRAAIVHKDRELASLERRVEQLATAVAALSSAGDRLRERSRRPSL